MHYILELIAKQLESTRLYGSCQVYCDIIAFNDKQTLYLSIMFHLPIMAVNNSGAELPAAMKVAPATSSLKPSF